MSEATDDINYELAFSDYQEQAYQTAVYPESAKVFYPILGLLGEAGELANKAKKLIRDGKELDIDDAAKELGDILWYVSAVAYDLGIDLGYIADRNLQKLFDRMERGVIGGSGDDR